MKLTIKTGCLDGNHHHWPKGAKQGETIYGPAAKVVALGRDSWQLHKGRTLVGRRLWIYAFDGRCWNFDVYLVFRRSPFAAGRRCGPNWRRLAQIAPDFATWNAKTTGFNPALWSVSDGR